MVDPKRLIRAVDNFAMSVQDMCYADDEPFSVGYFEELVGLSPVYLYAYDRLKEKPITRLARPFVARLTADMRANLSSHQEKDVFSLSFEEDERRNAAAVLVRAPGAPHDLIRAALGGLREEIEQLRAETGTRYPNFPWDASPQLDAIRVQLKPLLTDGTTKPAFRLLVQTHGEPSVLRRIATLVRCELGLGADPDVMKVYGPSLLVLEQFDPALFRKSRFCVTAMPDGNAHVDESQVHGRMEIPLLSKLTTGQSKVCRAAFVEACANKGIGPLVWERAEELDETIRKALADLAEGYDRLVEDFTNVGGLAGLNLAGAAEEVSRLAMPTKRLVREFLDRLCGSLSQGLGISAQFSRLVKNSTGKVVEYEPVTIRHLADKSSCALIRGLGVECVTEDTARFARALELTRDDPFTIYEYRCPISNKTCALKALVTHRLHEPTERQELVFSIGQYHVDSRAELPEAVLARYYYSRRELEQLLGEEPVFTERELTAVHAAFVVSAKLAAAVIELLNLPGLKPTPKLSSVLENLITDFSGQMATMKPVDKALHIPVRVIRDRSGS